MQRCVQGSGMSAMHVPIQQHMKWTGMRVTVMGEAKGQLPIAFALPWKQHGYKATDLGVTVSNTGEWQAWRTIWKMETGSREQPQLTHFNLFLCTLWPVRTYLWNEWSHKTYSHHRTAPWSTYHFHKEKNPLESLSATAERMCHCKGRVKKATQR